MTFSVARWNRRKRTGPCKLGRTFFEMARKLFAKRLEPRAVSNRGSFVQVKDTPERRRGNSFSGWAKNSWIDETLGAAASKKVRAAISAADQRGREISGMRNAFLMRQQNQTLNQDSRHHDQEQTSKGGGADTPCRFGPPRCNATQSRGSRCRTGLHRRAECGLLLRASPSRGPLGSWHPGIGLPAFGWLGRRAPQRSSASRVHPQVEPIKTVAAVARLTRLKAPATRGHLYPAR